MSACSATTLKNAHFSKGVWWYRGCEFNGWMSWNWVCSRTSAATFAGLGTLSNLLCGTLCIQSNNSDVMMKTSRVSWKCLIYVPWKYLKVLEFDSGDVTCYITHFFWSLPLKCQTVCTITISQMNVLRFFSGCSLWQSVSSCSAEFVVGWVHTCPAEALSRRGEVDLLASTGRRAFVVCSGSFGALWNVATLSREM